MKTAGFQVQLNILSMKSRVAQRIVEILQDVRDVKTVSFDKVKVLASDFDDTSLPAIQLIDVSQTGIHEQGRVKYAWLVALELVMKQSVDRTVNQQDLWNLEYQVKRKLWKNPNLKIPGVIDIKFVNAETDLHLLEPYYFARIFFEVTFYEAIVRDC